MWRYAHYVVTIIKNKKKLPRLGVLKQRYELNVFKTYRIDCDVYIDKCPGKHEESFYVMLISPTPIRHMIATFV